MNRRITISENELHRIVENSVRRLVNEGFFGKDPDASFKRDGEKVMALLQNMAATAQKAKDTSLVNSIEEIYGKVERMITHRVLGRPHMIRF